MMGLEWLLLPALAGYILQTVLHQFRYRTLRQSGQHVVFRSAVTGSILVFVAHWIVLFVKHYDSTAVDYLNNAFNFDYTATVVLSFFLALTFWPVNNLLADRDKAAIRAAKENGDLKGVFATEAIETCESVEVSLNTGKVYIGQVVQSGIGMSSEFDLMITPMYSGYRDRETNDLIITQFYDYIIRDIERMQDHYQHDQDHDSEELEIRPSNLVEYYARIQRQKEVKTDKGHKEQKKGWKDLRIGISLSDVISIRYFDAELYLSSSPPRIFRVHE